MQALELLDKNREELKAREFIGRLNGTGMHPKSIIGGAVYMAGILMGERRTQREVALAVGAAEADIEITV